MTANRLLYGGISLALALVAALTFVNARTSVALAQADRVYDQIERTRAERWLENQTSIGLSQADRVYDQIERTRAERWLETQRLGAAVSPKDLSYEGLERIRAHRGVPFADRSYDQIEVLRLTRTSGH